MNPNHPDIYSIGVPAAWRGELEDAIRTAAIETGATDRYSVSEVDPQEASSELKFDPVTPLILLKLVLEGISAALIGIAVERVVKKIESSGAGGARIVVLFPDGEVETIETSDAAATRAAIKKLKDGAV